MSTIIVAFFLLLIMRELWQRHLDRFRCAYCGAHKGHRQDCPFDTDQRKG